MEQKKFHTIEYWSDIGTHLIISSELLLQGQVGQDGRPVPRAGLRSRRGQVYSLVRA